MKLFVRFKKIRTYVGRISGEFWWTTIKRVVKIFLQETINEYDSNDKFQVKLISKSSSTNSIIFIIKENADNVYFSWNLPQKEIPFNGFIWKI